MGRGVESVCGVLRELGLAIAPRTYRAWRTRPPSQSAVTDAETIDRLLSLMAGEIGPPLFSSSTDPDAAFDAAKADPDTVARAWEAWRTEVAFSETLVAKAADLDVLGHEPGVGPVSLRWVMMHMIEEYARHNGHADLLREQIDGVVGL